MSSATVKVAGSTDEAEILSLILGIHKAHYEKNAAAIAAPYAKDAAFYSLAPPLTHVGRNVAEIQAWLDTWATPIKLTERDFKVTVSGDLAIAYGFLQMNGTKKGAEGSVSFWMRETVCL
ncbi:MAG: nuclear transport factor 2 family protein, partial [Silvibacterium sp.]